MTRQCDHYIVGGLVFHLNVLCNEYIATQTTYVAPIVAHHRSTHHKTCPLHTTEAFTVQVDELLGNFQGTAIFHLNVEIHLQRIIQYLFQLICVMLCG